MQEEKRRAQKDRSNNPNLKGGEIVTRKAPYIALYNHIKGLTLQYCTENNKKQALGRMFGSDLLGRLLFFGGGTMFGGCLGRC